MEMNRTEQNYKVEERAEDAIKKHGTIEKAISDNVIRLARRCGE